MMVTPVILSICRASSKPQCVIREGFGSDTSFVRMVFNNDVQRTHKPIASTEELLQEQCFFVGAQRTGPQFWIKRRHPIKNVSPKGHISTYRAGGRTCSVQVIGTSNPPA